MVIHDLYLGRVALAPHEADAPLVVDANAVLPLSVAFQLFKPVTGRSGQVAKPHGEMQLLQFSPGNALDGSKSLHPLAVEQSLRIDAAKGCNHRGSV